MFAKTLSRSKKCSFLIVLGFVIFLANFSTAVASNFTPKLPTINIQQWTTNNGVRVYFVAAPEIPIVDIAVVFKAGSARDDTKPGVSYLTNTMLDQGAQGLSANQIAEQFENVGAAYSHNINRDMSLFRLRSLTAANFLNPALQTFIRMLNTPTFPANNFKGEQQQLLNAVTQKNDSLSSLANDAFFQGLYGNHPYGRPMTGTHDSVSTITREDLQAFYKRYYVAKNAVVVLVGSIDKNQARLMANQITRGFTVGQEAPALTLNTVAPAKVAEQVIHHPSKQSHITLGQIGVTRTDPDYFSLYMGNHILGGDALIARLGEEVRQKRGLGYVIESYFQPMESAGPFQIEMETPNHSRAQALQVTKVTVKKYVNEGPTLQELVDARQNIIGGFPLRISSNEAILMNVVNIAFYQLPLNYLDIFKNKMETVTRYQIQSAWQRRIHPDQFFTVIVGQ